MELKTKLLRVAMTPRELAAVDQLAALHRQKTTDFVRGVFGRMAIEQGVLPDPFRPAAETGPATPQEATLEQAA